DANDLERRLSELNCGFPPAAKGKWQLQLSSEPYPGREAAETAEQQFKDGDARKLPSLGGEFFCGDLPSAESIFATIPGVSRFGR
ncbi:MAG: hypothetical protein JWN93_1479, partial [Hyphomicrobiales bacterium]|nr:hypothetical protein [Hyphomicrobiales bacterium]